MIFSLLALLWKINKSRLMRSPHSVSVRVSPLTVVRQRLSKHVSAAMNTHATTEELLEVSISIRCVTYQRKVGD
jgi:hypothetical protein